MDTLEELNNLTKELDIQVNNLPKTGKEYAEAYTKYRVALAKKMLELRNDNTPVTICSDLARGDIEVARLKFKEISKEAVYKANLEGINATKLRIKVLENQYDKEYTNVN